MSTNAPNIASSASSNVPLRPASKAIFICALVPGGNIFALLYHSSKVICAPSSYKAEHRHRPFCQQIPRIEREENRQRREPKTLRKHDASDPCCQHKYVCDVFHLIVPCGDWGALLMRCASLIEK